MYKFFQIFKRDFTNLLINSTWLFYCTLFPLLLVLIFGFLSSGDYGTLMSSYDYYSITIMIYMILVTATLAANSFMEERIKNGNMRLIYSPIKSAYIYLSKIAATFLFSSACHLVVILMLYLITGANFGGANCGYILFLFLLLEMFASALGVLCCCIFKTESTANQFLSLLISIIAIMGGLFFRLQGLGTIFERVSSLSPAKWFKEAIFIMIYDSDFSYFLPITGCLLSACIIILVLCGIFFRTEDYL